MLGMAVATIVASIAASSMASITATMTSPRLVVRLSWLMSRIGWCPTCWKGLRFPADYESICRESAPSSKPGSSLRAGVSLAGRVVTTTDTKRALTFVEVAKEDPLPLSVIKL